MRDVTVMNTHFLRLPLNNQRCTMFYSNIWFYSCWQAACFNPTGSPPNNEYTHSLHKLPIIIRFTYSFTHYRRPRGLRRRSAVARSLGLWVRIPPGAWMSVSCECCLLLGRGLCVWLIIRPGEFYLVWRVWVWSRSLENEEARPTRGCCAIVKKIEGSNTV